VLPLAGFDARVGTLPAAAAAARGVVVASAVLAFGYLLNAVADRGSDRPGKNPFAAAGAPRGAGAVAAGLAAAALVASAWAPPVARAATAVSLASGVVYSVGPRLKRYPLLGTLANVTNFAPLLWVGVAAGAQPPGLRAVAAGFVCLLLQNQLLHEAADRQEDRAGHVRTTVLLLGEGRSALVASLLGAALLAAVRTARAFGAVAGPLALAYVVAFPLALALRGADAAAMNRARAAHRACSVLTGGLLFALLR